MKKVVKIVSFSLILATLISIALCYIIIPDRTKLAFDVVVDYLNKPLPIVGVSIIVFGGVVAYIISKTQFGKQLLNSFKSELDTFRVENEKKKQELEELQKTLEIRKSEINAYLSNFSKRIDVLEGKLIKVCETSPNAKIKALASEIDSHYQETKVELTTKLEDLHEYSDEQIKTLEQRLLELERLVKEYGEKGKETINSNTKEE